MLAGDDGALPVLSPGTGLFVRADWRFIHEYYTGMAAHLLDEAYEGRAHRTPRTR
jgi:hypothetical protein